MTYEAFIYGFGLVIAWVSLKEKIWTAWFALFFWILAFASLFLSAKTDFEVLPTISGDTAGLLFLIYIVTVNIRKEGKGNDIHDSK